MAEDDRLPCKTCGASILPATALKNNGECAPCKGGFRVDRDAAKKWREEQKVLYDAPEAIFWRSLVERVYKDVHGFDGLTEPEKLYFAVCSLDGEVYNGGMDQYFVNSSADYYSFAIQGLKVLDAKNSLSLLLEAKELLFADSDVPADEGMRREILLGFDLYSDDSVISKKFKALDDRYYEDSDSLDDLLRRFAIENEFWTGSS